MLKTFLQSLLPIAIMMSILFAVVILNAMKYGGMF